MTNPRNYPLNDEQKKIVVETIEEIGVENLCMSITHALTHTNCHQLPVEDRERVYKFLHGIFLVSNQELPSEN